MESKKKQIKITYLFHAFFILISLMLMDYDPLILIVIFVIAGISYIIYWIIMGRKSYMPWIVYLNFLIGTAIEVLLNFIGVISGDSGLLGEGLWQLIYVTVLLIYAALLGIVNFVMWLLDKTIRILRS